MFTVLKADEPLFEGKDIAAVNLDVLGDQVKEIAVVKDDWYARGWRKRHLFYSGSG